jgi:hypothetical protein
VGAAVARPDTDDGFVQIALDLFAAIMAADLPNRDMIVLAELLLHSYGPRKQRRVFLDPTQIEHLTGLHRNNARAAIKSLHAAGLAVANDDGSYTFVKDWESWHPRGRSIAERLTGGIVRFARSALAQFRRKARTQPDASTVDPIQPDCNINDHPNPPELHRNSVELRSRPAAPSDWIATDVDARSGVDEVTHDEPKGSGDALACGRAHAGADLEIRDREEEKAGYRQPGGGGRETVYLDLEQMGAAVALALDLLGKDAARVLKNNARRVAEKTGGEWARVCVAIRMAAASRKPIRNIVAWVIGVANELTAEEVEAGGEVVAFDPKATAREKSDFMARILALQERDKTNGAR